MVRTSPFSIRLAREVREMIEYHAQVLRLKPSVLAAMILRDCTEKWVKNYAEELYDKYIGEKKS